MANRSPLALTVDEAAALLRVSETHIRQMCADGELPSIRLGSCLRIPVTQLSALLNGMDWRAPEVRERLAVAQCAAAGAASVTREPMSVEEIARLIAETVAAATAAAVSRSVAGEERK